MAHQQVLLMISNNNLSLREVYSAVLANEFPGWRVSYMTAMPERHQEILASYTLVIYELGKADDPRRIEIVRVLGDELRAPGGPTVYTRLEGFLPANVAAELAEHNVRVSTGALSWEGLAQDLRQVAGRPPEAQATPPEGSSAGRGVLGRLGGLFRRDRNKGAPPS